MSYRQQRFTNAASSERTNSSVPDLPSDREALPNFGAVLRARRKEAGLSREQLSRKMGVSVFWIQNQESDKAREPTDRLLGRLVAVPELNLTWDFVRNLLGRKPQPAQPRLGALLRARREAAGLTREQLSHNTGIPLLWILNQEVRGTQASKTFLSRLIAVPELKLNWDLVQSLPVQEPLRANRWASSRFYEPFNRR